MNAAIEVAGNYFFMAFLAFLCLFPIIHVLAVSFSSSGAAAAGRVGLWPVEFTFKAYEFVIRKVEFTRSFGVSLLRLVLACGACADGTDGTDGAWLVVFP